MTDNINWYQRLTAVQQQAQSDSAADEISKQVNLALGYAWGIQDASGVARDSQDASNFSYAYGEHAGLYHLEKLPYRRNVADCYSRWVDGRSFND